MLSSDPARAKGKLYLLYSDSLLASGLDILLRERGVEASKVDLRHQDFADFLRDLGQRDVVLLDSGDKLAHSLLPVLHTLAHNLDIVVVDLNAEKNLVYIFERKQKAARSVDDFFKIMESLHGHTADH